jgi:DNA repair exonuclease SbcCD nuclease subunit
LLKKLTKTASFTDIHWGCKGNSEQHNQDCLNFIQWFCDIVRADPSIDNVIFLGDWFENRAALNVSTMNWSYRGAEMLNDLGIPVFFIIGNHDLFHRHTRAIYSPINFQAFSNFQVITDPVVVDEIGSGALLSPFLFPDEYQHIRQHLNLDTWWGHFEFKDFIVTGYNVKMPTGPDPRDFKGPKNIFSGHFHKRQTAGNITYIGNTFPTNFGDAGDTDRGMVVYDHKTHKLEYKNWDNCPQYVKAPLTSLLDGSIVLPPNARVKCIVDVPISFEESNYIKDTYVGNFDLREFAMEESGELDEALTSTRIVGTAASMGETVDELVIKMLSAIKSDHINKDILIDLYKGLPT